MKRALDPRLRQFLATAAAASASAAPDSPRSGETEHFRYRERAPGRYIDSQRGSRAFAHADGKVGDSNGPKAHDHGIFRCDPKDLLSRDTHERLFNPEVEQACVTSQDETILAAHCAPSTLNTGFTVPAGIDHKRSPTRLHEKDSEGWFRVDFRSGWIEHAEVIFIRPKPARRA